MNSITYRITGLMFLAVALTVFLLIFLANRQMTDQFQEYLIIQHMGMGQTASDAGSNHTMTIFMGPLEQNFLASVHQSLIWVGLVILLGGLAASYALARSITIPLRRLSIAAEQIQQGNFNQSVPVASEDEVGHLAIIFNRMADTLAKNNEMRRQFLANIAHELKTPLAIIQGHLEGILDGVLEPSTEQISSLHEEAIRLNRLIKDLKDLSLAEVRQLALEKRLTDVNQVMARAVYMIKPLADEKLLKIDYCLSENLPEIYVDTDRIRQVIYNILLNAIRYSQFGEIIQVATGLKEEDGRLWIAMSIKDNGSGIAPEDIPYIFDHFYRGDKSRDRKSGGSGLGLAIVKQLAEIHGGKAYVENGAVKGSIFTVLLPVNEIEKSKRNQKELHL